MSLDRHLEGLGLPEDVLAAVRADEVGAGDERARAIVDAAGAATR